MKAILIIRVIASLIPVLIESIKAVEEALPGKGKGEQKLAMVRQLIEAAYAVGGNMSLKFDEIWPLLNDLIATAVAGFNKAGEFSK